MKYFKHVFGMYSYARSHWNLVLNFSLGAFPCRGIFINPLRSVDMGLHRSSVA